MRPSAGVGLHVSAPIHFAPLRESLTACGLAVDSPDAVLLSFDPFAATCGKCIDVFFGGRELPEDRSVGFDTREERGGER
jgi:hypothetical protein